VQRLRSALRSWILASAFSIRNWRRPAWRPREQGHTDHPQKLLQLGLLLLPCGNAAEVTTTASAAPLCPRRRSSADQQQHRRIYKTEKSAALLQHVGRLLLGKLGSCPKSRSAARGTSPDFENRKVAALRHYRF
jgi:hypothetical protein